MPKNGFKYEVENEQYFTGIGVENAKSHCNTGIIFRTALCMGMANFLFTCGDIKYDRPHSDTAKSTLSLPTFNFKSFEDLYNHQPMNSVLIGVELCDRAIDIENFVHPKRGVYLFGAEDSGLSKQATKSCTHIIKLPSKSGCSLNLASSAAMVMMHRYLQLKKIGMNI